MKSQKQIEEKAYSMRTYLKDQKLVLSRFQEEKKPLEEYATAKKAQISRDQITVTRKVIKHIEEGIWWIDWTLSDSPI